MNKKDLKTNEYRVTAAQDKGGLTVALAGSPNSGKTTIFNNITGARQHVGNYPGVTVEHKTGEKKHLGYNLKVIDLPGTYSLTAYSEEEVVTRNFLINEKPDIVINVVDASNLERNLYLTTQLIELGVNTVIAFNMSDLLQRSGTELDLHLLTHLFGAPIVYTIGNKNVGTEGLLDSVIDAFEKREQKKIVSINYGEEIENEIIRISDFLNNDHEITSRYDLRWLSVKLLERDTEVLEGLKDISSKDFYGKLSDLIEKSSNHIQNILRSTPGTLIAEARYAFINGALKEAVIKKRESEISASDRIDQVLLNRIFGLPIFALIMYLIFQIVFRLGDYPTRWLTIGFVKLAELITAVMPESLVASLIVDGIIAGVGGVLVFTPKIMLLFISIAVLEDSGYMARAAFIMDRIMHRIGLHGKSFVPMLIGFGCTVPAYMCGRTLENKNDRLITMHINTFMSCGGRLPIYILFAGAFFPRSSGNIIFIIYVIGILMAIAFAKVLRATRFKGESEPFVMELPIYRIPTFKGILIHMWERTWQYIKKAGTVILALSIIIWILFTFPMLDLLDYEEQIAGVEQSFAEGKISQETYNTSISAIKAEMSAKQLEYSAAGRIGRFVEPVFKPLGFDWRLSLASLTGIAGKEVVVSTLGTIYSLSDTENETGNLKSELKDTYHPLVGFNFMLFSLLYFPCIAGLAVFQREAGTKEMLFQASFTLLLAWGVSFIVFQIGRFFI
jgi:ferrous iron transport protein B